MDRDSRHLACYYNVFSTSWPAKDQEEFDRVQIEASVRGGARGRISGSLCVLLDLGAIGAGHVWT